MTTKHLPLVVPLLGTILTMIHPACAQTWTQTSAPVTNWSSVASSADGSKLIAAVGDPYGPPGHIYTSTNSGATWAPTTAPITNWAAVASSADGARLVAAAGGIYYNYSPIFTSADSGATWIQTSAPITNWTGIASSADGMKLVAVSWGLAIYTSTNAGTTRMAASNVPPYHQWTAVASSADGTTLLAAGCMCFVAQAGRVTVSVDSGLSWTQTEILSYSASVASVASSADGSKLVTAGLFALAASMDAGATWIKTNTHTQAVASSADGTKLVALDAGRTYVSTNGGVTWTQTNAPSLNWRGVASSADGNKLVVVADVGGIYVWHSSVAPSLSIKPSNRNVVLSWIVPSLDFVLQENTDLSTTNWTVVTNSPALNLTNVQQQVTLPGSAVHRFYRLKH